jgi:hypothetical protein
MRVYGFSLAASSRVLEAARELFLQVAQIAHQLTRIQALLNRRSLFQVVPIEVQLFQALAQANSIR